jgi:hypothetical protein
MLKPKWLKIVDEEETHTVCSWCGVNVPTAGQQTIHEQWHRAAGVMPLYAESVPDKS